MFNRIALMWVWALIFAAGLRFPLVKGNWHGLYMFVLMILLAIQLIFVVTMTWKEYHRLKRYHGEFQQGGIELEQQALYEAGTGTYGR